MPFTESAFPCCGGPVPPAAPDRDAVLVAEVGENGFLDTLRTEAEAGPAARGSALPLAEPRGESAWTIVCDGVLDAWGDETG